MRQRVVIAIALALDPKLLILDEPTTALDVVVQQEIMQQIRELQRKFGFSILFITHDISLMVEMSDRMGVCTTGGWWRWHRRTSCSRSSTTRIRRRS